MLFNVCSGLFRACSGLFRACSGLFRACSGLFRVVPDCSVRVPAFHIPVPGFRTCRLRQFHGTPELHVFADASVLAYGAAAYLVWPSSTGKEVRLVSAKARVAPLRQTTIPGLELTWQPLLQAD